MTEAVFYGSEKSGFTGFRISGHSGYADEGADIVCAAVSSAVGMTLQLLRIFSLSPAVGSDEGTATVTVSLINASGTFSGNAADGKNAKLLLLGLYRQLTDIESEYGKYLRVSTATRG